ncbi:hypothetical protein VQH23_05095 [Pararoseomonas sp. SCSIO 73927]|uniref:hypothetical protein n=1 Tax=Pararoseomonas sp. SCSIO 73927 TaxID=3114537 RepID=UPI0030CD3E2F
MISRILSTALAGLILSGSDVPSQELGGSTAAALSARALPDTIAYPEGIAHDRENGVYYVASAYDGAVARVRIGDNAATLVVPGGRLAPAGADSFPVTLGMKLDGSNRLWIAGGARGNLHVVDAGTGRTVTTLGRSEGPPGLLNDLAITADAAYVTDSSRPILWRVGRHGDGIGALEPWLQLEPAITYGEGPNLNGIVSTPDGGTLIAVQMNTGLLWRIDVATRAVTRIDLGGALLTGGDGLVLVGQRLYATLQGTSEIVAVDLAPGLASGSVVGRLRDARLVAPATAFAADGRLFVVATQFSRMPGGAALRPFNVYDVALSAID